MITKHILWAISLILSMVFFVVTAYHLTKVYNTYNPNLNQLVSNQTVRHYLDDYWKNVLKNKVPMPILIPTGLFINTIKWVDAQSFFISGYVWQKYTPEEKKIAHPGFVMPDATNLKKSIAYEYKEGENETIGWHFEGTLNQNFDYKKYPMDLKEIKIRLWHANFDQEALLVPDLVSYDQSGVRESFGLKPGIFLGGYTILDSYFLYQHLYYDSNFGLPDFSRRDFPELYYGAILKRDVVDAIVVHLLPISIVLFLCFLMLLASTFEDKRRTRLKFNYLDVLTACAALFFVVILAHVHFRESFPGISFMYFEYLYVIAYLSLLFVTVNALFVARADLADHFLYRFISFEDNLWPKILYFPVVTLALLILSYVFF